MSITWKQAMSLFNELERGDISIKFLHEETCLRKVPKRNRLELCLAKDAEPEHLLHELAHYELLHEGTSPWFKMPLWVCEKWAKGTLTGEWKEVADEANRVDHMMVENKVREFIQKLND